MARGGGGGARKVRPEGQNMRCVVQLLTAGGKGGGIVHERIPCVHPQNTISQTHSHTVGFTV
jgi:hypothetical protein